MCTNNLKSITEIVRNLKSFKEKLDAFKTECEANCLKVKNEIIAFINQQVMPKITTNTTDITSLQNTVSTNTTNITLNKNEINNTSGLLKQNVIPRVSTLETKVKTAENNISTLQNGLSDVETKYDNLERYAYIEINSCKDRLNNCDSHIQTLQTNTTDLQNKYNALNTFTYNEIDSLKNKVYLMCHNKTIIGTLDYVKPGDEIIAKFLNAEEARDMYNEMQSLHQFTVYCGVMFGIFIVSDFYGAVSGSDFNVFMYLHGHTIMYSFKNAVGGNITSYEIMLDNKFSTTQQIPAHVQGTFAPLNDFYRYGEI